MGLNHHHFLAKIKALRWIELMLNVVLDRLS